MATFVTLAKISVCDFLFLFFYMLPSFSVTPSYKVEESISLFYSDFRLSDTIQNRQDLYNGIKWTNKYRKFDVSQFLFSDLFLQGTVTMNSKTYKNVRLKYDIVNDEIITPVSLQDIVQLNKEMVDSFSLVFDGKRYSFVNIKKDTLDNLSGYLQQLYMGNSSLFVKHKKSYLTSADPDSEGTFNESHTIYFVTGDYFHNLTGRKSLYKVLRGDRVDEVKSFIRENKLKVSKKIPSSFTGVIRYYDATSNTDQK
jgi:hypothetical protein